MEKVKVLIYGRRHDELADFARLVPQLGIEPTFVKENLDRDNAALAAGFEGVAVNALCLLDRENIARLAQLGVKYLATRSIGFDNIDLDACREFGIKLSNAPYSPHSVADYTVMLMLMLTRRAKSILRHGEAQDYTLRGIEGRELRSMTVGVIGTGRIGRTVIEDLSGFGPKFIAYDLYPSEALRGRVEYVPLDELFARADIITLHAPLQESSFHTISAASIAKMKDGAMIVNTARGELIDTAALIAGLESGKLGGAALDVLEGEQAYMFGDHRCDNIPCRERALLMAFPNVILTGHYAFYTEQAVTDQVEMALSCLRSFIETGKAPNEIV